MVKPMKTLNKGSTLSYLSSCAMQTLAEKKNSDFIIYSLGVVKVVIVKYYN